MGNERWISFRVEHLETDLWIAVSREKYTEALKEYARQKAVLCREQLDRYIARHPHFLSSLVPVQSVNDGFGVINEMYRASEAAGTGPMAAVAGAVAEYVCNCLAEKFDLSEVVVENGGDIFLRLAEPATVSVYAGKSILSDKIGIAVKPEQTPLSLCCSSATVGHSFSLGSADAAMIAARSGALADAYATACCNAVKSIDSVAGVTEEFISKEGVLSVVIIKDDKVGVGGSLEIVVV